ncbi:hypothetical protein [Pelagibius sp.]|uniref:hypothetical protein n=1 Tax=Pelagibius sp. TaxID=1931238 RepID=UPI003BAFEA17
MASSADTARARELAYKISRASSDEERVTAVNEFFESPDSIPDHVKDEIKEDLVDDIKSGFEFDAYDEIRDDLIEEVKAEVSETIEQQAAWVFVRDKAIEHAVQSTIDALSLLFEIVRKDNSIASVEGVLTPIQKEQLLAILRATIAELEAPYVDKGRIAKLTEWIVDLGKRAVEKKISGEVAEGLDSAQGHLNDLLDKTSGIDPSSPF